MKPKSPYDVVRRIDWIRRNLETGKPFNSNHISAEFGNCSIRTAARDIAFTRAEYYGDRLRYDVVERTFYLE
jgi:hypothetical protein